MITRIETVNTPAWAVTKQGESWWPAEPVTAEVAVKKFSCPVCGRETTRIHLGERRPQLPQDDNLPLLLVWEAWESPRGAHGPRYLHYLGVKCSHRGGYTGALLLAPESQYQWVTTRRYYNKELWPRYDEVAKAGVAYEHESDETSFLLVWGEILSLPVVRLDYPHSTCLHPPKRVKVGCQQLVYYPHLGVLKALGLGIEILVVPSGVKWDGSDSDFMAWGYQLPIAKEVWEDFYPRALEALDEIGLWLYAEADENNNLTGRVAVQVKD